MTKQFTLLQLFSIIDGRLSTNMDDVYNMLNHICDESLMTHHLPVALDYVKEKNPKWFKEQKQRLEIIGRTFYTPIIGNEFNIKDIPFKDFIEIITKKYNDLVDIPQLKDEFDTSDFDKFMIDNSLLLKKVNN